MKAVVAAFNQEKALVGAFSAITNLQMDLFEALVLDLQLQTCCYKTKVSLLLVRCRCIWRFYETRTHWDIGQLRQGSDGVKPETDSLYFMTSCYVGFLLLWRMKHDHNKGKILPFSALALFARITRIHLPAIGPRAGCSLGSGGCQISPCSDKWFILL